MTSHTSACWFRSRFCFKPRANFLDLCSKFVNFVIKYFYSSNPFHNIPTIVQLYNKGCLFSFISVDNKYKRRLSMV